MRSRNVLCVAILVLLFIGCATVPTQLSKETSTALSEGQKLIKYQEYKNIGIRSYHDTRNYADALDAFLKANEYNEEDADVKAYIGVCYYYLGKKQKAIEIINSYLTNEKDPDPTIYHSIAGIYGYNLGQVDRAIELFYETIKYRKNYVSCWDYIQLAEMYVLKGDKKMAKEYFEKGLKRAEEQNDKNGIESARKRIGEI